MPIDRAVRTTGATDEQIEAAARRWWELHHADDPEGWADWDDDRNFLIGDTKNEASYLVDTEHRIVSVADLQAIHELAKSSKWAPGNLMLLDRIAGVIGGTYE